MGGTYQMVSETGENFEIEIPTFSLDTPGGARQLNNPPARRGKDGMNKMLKKGEIGSPAAGVARRRARRPRRPSAR